LPSKKEKGKGGGRGDRDSWDKWRGKYTVCLERGQREGGGEGKNGWKRKTGEEKWTKKGSQGKEPLKETNIKKKLGDGRWSPAKQDRAGNRQREKTKQKTEERGKKKKMTKRVLRGGGGRRKGKG